ncbi:hypothetical protein DD721_05830 [Bifidobacterium longum]|nr:hypothetical protein DD678_00575 [Bifidobacterium longum]PVV48294.1 hypothetical protein DD701_04195 [Bifidobacterium longum]PVV58831.1 hypothetical protein DD721_05830 [Bifidobacterium longum]PVV59130.1 hypothetical protein DD705_06410 [Bifidobacterium longum]
MVDSQYQSVLVRADTLELHVEATLVMQEHAGAIAVDRTVREQHTNGECGLHILRQRQECLVGVPVRVVHHGGTGHVGVTVAILVDVSHERQIPGVVFGELCLEVLDLGQRRVAQAEALGHFIGLGCFRIRVLAEHIRVDDDDFSLRHNVFLSAWRSPSKHLGKYWHCSIHI